MFFRRMFGMAKEKRKRKRDIERLEQYRDWPPDLVDTFLAFDEMMSKAPYGVESKPPEGYFGWIWKVEYAEYLARPERYKNPGVIFIKR